MNWNERFKVKQNLMEHLADLMIRRGQIKRDNTRSNPYTCVRIVELTWMNQPFTIVEVDGEVCRIDRE